MRKLSIFLALMLLMLACAGCGLTAEEEDPLPEETIEEFEDAVNNMDVQGMLDCMSEDMQSTATSALDIVLNIASAVTGIKISSIVKAEDLINVLPLVQAILPYSDYADMETVDYQVHTTYIKGDKATVYFTEANSGENMVINMVLEDGKWVFAMTTTPLTEEEAERVIIDGVEQVDETESGNAASAGDLNDLIADWLNGLLN